MKILALLFIFTSILLGCGVSGSSDSAGDVTSVKTTYSLHWNVPTRRANGGALLLGEIKGYELCYAKDDNEALESGAEEASAVGGGECIIFEVDDPSQDEYDLGDLLAGVYRFTLTLIDTNDNFSKKSAKLEYLVQ